MKNLNYHTKSAFELKDMDSAKRQVAVYLSKFDNIDSDADVIRRGAFTKSIQERGVDSASNRKIAFLRHHDWTMPIGKWLQLGEDEKGLYGVGELGRSTIAEDAWKDYEDGIIREHSIGFKYIQDKMRWIEDKSLETGGFYDITEVKLYEGSAVTFGANEFTNVIDVIKNENKDTVIQRINDDINLTLKALKNGQGSDERLYSLEMKIKLLTSQLTLLATAEPIKNHSVQNEPTIEKAFDWNAVISKISK